MFERLELLIGNKIDLIKEKNILIIGLGGVGGYAVESLIRSGIEHITIVDNDTIDLPNTWNDGTSIPGDNTGAVIDEP